MKHREVYQSIQERQLGFDRADVHFGEVTDTKRSSNARTAAAIREVALDPATEVVIVPKNESGDYAPAAFEQNQIETVERLTT